MMPSTETGMPPKLLLTVLLLIALAGIVFFLAPMAVRIINVGNLFGLGCSVLLLCYVIFHKQVHAIIGKIRSAAAGRIALTVLAVFVLLGVLYCLILSGMMLHAAYRKPQDKPQAVIVLGCKVRGTVPSLMLSRRIQAAYQKLNEDPSLIAVVSGGKGDNEDISEAECMANELTRMGIAPERILMENRSTSTSENLRFSKELLDENGITGNLLIATDVYHEYRAQILAGKEGLPECYAAPAHTSWYLIPTYWVREWFGLSHAFVFGT
jgi:uncharacterized SAM-binding protein YcdF (DUF218 family)